jgi:hypothetical protein
MIHAPRNVTSKLPERHHSEVKARWWKLFDEARSAGEARQQSQALIGDYRAAYPSAMAVIERDLDALVTHLRFPSEHRKRIRNSTENCPRGDDRNRTGVDGFAVRRKAVLLAYLSRFRRRQVLSGALKKRSCWESLGELQGTEKLAVCK